MRIPNQTLIPSQSTQHVWPWTIGDWNYFFWTGCYPHETFIGGPNICVESQSIRVPSVGGLTSERGNKVAGINKCGHAACLCSGSFCADLIDANYCSDFHCAENQCICIF